MTTPRIPATPSLDDDEPSAEELATLSSRAVAYQRSLDPGDLWPGMSEDDLQSAADAIGRTVRSVLAGSPTELVCGALSEEALGIAGLITGVGPLLGYWSETGVLSVDDRLRVVLANHLRHGRLRAARIRSAIERVLPPLASCGVTAAAMKGFHTAHEYFPDPGTRPFSDVDLVVAPDEIARTREVLRREGYVEGVGYDSPYKHEWRAADQDERARSFHFWHARSKWNIELHDHVNFEHLRGQHVRTAPLNVLDGVVHRFGVPLRVAHQPQLLAMLAAHASGELYASRLLRTVELILVIRKDTERGLLDWNDVRRVLRDANVQRFAYPAFRLVEQLSPGTVDAAVLRDTLAASTRRTLHAVRAFTPTSPLLHSGTSMAERLMWMAGPWAVLHRLWLMLAPVENASFRAVLVAYRSRLHRLLTGAVRWRVKPERRHDAKSRS